jgi:hypothetical protein
MASKESAERMRCDQWDNAVAEHPELVHPGGHPISHSTNSGFKLRRSIEDGAPGIEISGAGREEGKAFDCPSRVRRSSSRLPLSRV